MRAKNVSTTLVIALFLIISASGIFLLLHIGGYTIKAVHQWLGLAFVLFGVLHATANCSLIKRYLNGTKGTVIVLTVISALGFSMLAPSGNQAPPS